MKPNLNTLTKEKFKDWTPIESNNILIGFEKDYLDGHALNYVSRKNAQLLAINAEIEKVKAKKRMVQDFGFYLYGDLPAGRSIISRKLDDVHRKLDQELAELDKLREDFIKV